MAYLRSISTAKQSVRFVQSDMKYKYCTSMNLDSLLRYLISAREGETNGGGRSCVVLYGL
jgi:hypothetical protein